MGGDGPGTTATRSGRYALGVLFVHGIGDQQRGETLGTWSIALTRWLRGWLGGDGRNGPRVDLRRVPVDRVRMTSADDGEGLEAAALRVTIGDKEGHWLLAESWWAQSVTAPRIGAFGSWLARVVPFLAIAQVWPHLRYNAEHLAALRHGLPRGIVLFPARLIRCVGAFALCLISVPLSAVIVVGVWLILLVLRLPLPGWKERVDKFAVRVAASLGDSYLLVQDPLQYDRMRDTVRNDLGSLARHCAAVAVVAHSQGAAIVHDVLCELAADAGHAGPTRLRASRLRVFASVGSGIWKLRRLRDLLYGLQRGVTLAPVWGILVTAGAVLVFLFGALLGAGAQLVVTGLLAAGGLLLVVLGLRATLAKVEDANPDAFKLDTKRFHPEFRWVDFWSTSDPVPNGPLVTTPTDGKSEPQTRKIYNLASMLSDHSAYAGNYDQFWPLLVGELFAADAGGDYWTAWRDSGEYEVVPVPEAGKEERLEAWRQRRNRVQWLMYARVTAAVLAVLAFVTAPAARTSLGQWLLDACTRAALLPDKLQQACGTPIGQQTDPAWYAGLIERLRHAPTLVGGIVLAALALGVYLLLVRPLWRSWQRATDEIVVHQRRPADPSWRGLAFKAAALIFSLPVIAAAWFAPAGAPAVAAGLSALWLVSYYIWQALDTHTRLAEPDAGAAQASRADGDVKAGAGEDSAGATASAAPAQRPL